MVINQVTLQNPPGNLPVVYLVTQVGNWGTGNDDVGLIQSTKAPNPHLEIALRTCAGPHFGRSRPVVGRLSVSSAESTRASLSSVRSKVSLARRRPLGRIPPWCHLLLRVFWERSGCRPPGLWWVGGGSAPQNRLVYAHLIFFGR